MLNSIQILRALAAWLVVGHHYMQLFYSFKLEGFASGLLRDFGAIGVDLFFVISGFVIYSSSTSKTTTPLSFVVNRIARIGPAYWLFSSITALALIIAPDSIPLTAFELDHFLKSVFFVPAQNPSGIGLYPLMTIGWTLNYEAFFYLIFFAALYLPSNYRVFGLIIGVAITQAIATTLPGPISFYGNTIVWEFIFGVMLAIMYKRGMVSHIPISAAALMILGSIATITLLGPTSHSPLKSGLPCAAILCACLSQERFFPKHSFIARLGDWSYSTYLCHVLIISLAIKTNELYPTGPVLTAAGVISLILLTSYASYSLIEKPTTRKIKTAWSHAPKAT